MADPPLRPVPPPSPSAGPGPPFPGVLPVLEDPDHPGAFVVRRMGTLTVLLLLALCAVALLAGTLVRVGPVSLGEYVARQVGVAKLPSVGSSAP